MFLKFFFDALGTAAGVAWPSYSVAYTLLALVATVYTGGLAAIILGVAACAIFAGVFAWTFYRGTSNFLAFKKALLGTVFNFFEERQREQRQSLGLSFSQYLDEWLANHPLSSNLPKAFVQEFKKNTQLLEQYSQLNKNQKEKSLQKILHAFVQSKALRENVPALTFKKRLGEGISAFFSVYGSEVGCGVGSMSVLSNMGLIMGLAPLSAGFILGGGIFFAAFMAIKVMQGAREKHDKESIMQGFSEIKIKPIQCTEKPVKEQNPKRRKKPQAEKQFFYEARRGRALSRASLEVHPSLSFFSASIGDAQDFQGRLSPSISRASVRSSM